MAKRRPPVSLDEMERVLGYTVAAPEDVQHIHFYSDLTMVSPNVYDRTRRDFDEYLRTKQDSHDATELEQPLLQNGVKQTVTNDQCIVVLERIDCIGQYSFTADIYCGFGFHLPLQLTKDEASAAMSVAKLRRGNASDLRSQLFKLPREIRDEIYAYAIPRIELQIVGSGDRYGIDFSRGAGDPSGFYSPFRSYLGILAVNRQIRDEALQLAYRKTSMHLNNMDDFIRVAISIGKVGRENVESISFAWESPSDTECVDYGSSTSGFTDIRLPKLHSLRCVQLLRCFKRLRYLRLYFEDDLLSTLSLADFKIDRGIHELCSLYMIDIIDISNQSGESENENQTIKWIKKEIESAKRNDRMSEGSIGM